MPMLTDDVKKDDSIELEHLDVRYVSGVGQPATGERFLLAKAFEPKGKDDEDAVDQPSEPPHKKDGEAQGKKYSWDQCMKDNADAENAESVCAVLARGKAPKAEGEKEPATKSLDEYVGMDIILPEGANLAQLTKEAREEVSIMTTQANESLLQELGKRLAAAFGVREASSELVAAREAAQQAAAAAEIAAKASGYAPADDAGNGSHPNYTENNKPKTNIRGEAPADDKGTPSVSSKGVDGTTATQQAEIAAGSPVAGTVDRDTVVAGSPATAPVTKSAVDEFLSRLEATATNKEAVEAARLAMTAALEPAPQAPSLGVAEVKDMMMKGFDPLITAVEALDERVTALAEKLDAQPAAKGADDERLEILEGQVAELHDTLQAISGRVTKSVARVARSAVPATTEPVSKGDALWGDSVFGQAARIS